ncbi:hypothetical protein EYF80_053921 [Liparis tanakae]|uniref:Uncharacterized protein n=1 Tax=Liparis tanakae TaxID=230148 RepID=A0A4Z2F592_9TELE|nr:hypothetical protein EYF80_053921 [Liparis tanakae]
MPRARSVSKMRGDDSDECGHAAALTPEASTQWSGKTSRRWRKIIKRPYRQLGMCPEKIYTLLARVHPSLSVHFLSLCRRLAGSLGFGGLGVVHCDRRPREDEAPGAAHQQQGIRCNRRVYCAEEEEEEEKR